MVSLELSGIRGKGMFVLVDDEDVPVIQHRKWHLSRTKNKFYARCSYWKDGVVVNKKMHNLLIPAREGLVVDHINGNGLDNRRSNLRHITQKQNAQNRVKSSLNTSGVRGVYFSRGVKYPSGSWKRKPKWIATIQIDGLQKNVGYFDSKKDAVVSRKMAEIQHYNCR